MSRLKAKKELYQQHWVVKRILWPRRATSDFRLLIEFQLPISEMTPMSC